MATTTINDLLHHYREMSTDPTDFGKCFEVLTRQFLFNDRIDS